MFDLLKDGAGKIVDDYDENSALMTHQNLEAEVIDDNGDLIEENSEVDFDFSVPSSSQQNPQKRSAPKSSESKAKRKKMFFNVIDDD